MASPFAVTDPLFNCGPFEAAEGARSLKAFDYYWDRRPFVDAIETAASAQDSDVAELPLTGARRPRTDTHRLWSTAPVEAVSLEAPGLGANMREALSLAIDRSSIVKVMLQGRGEAAGGLLPQWASGWAFLFNTQQDLAKARGLLLTRPAPLTLSYPGGDSLLRLIADRVAVNARDAGIVIQTKPAGGDMRITREPLVAVTSYEAERAQIDERRLIPIVHLPRLFAIHSRVRGWESAHDGKSAAVHYESIWLDS